MDKHRDLLCFVCLREFQSCSKKHPKVKKISALSARRFRQKQTRTGMTDVTNIIIIYA